MKRYYLLFIFSTFLFSCSSLTESQIKNINVFSTSAKVYTDFPSIILKKRADISFLEKKVQAIQLAPNDKAIDTLLSNSKKSYDSQLKKAEQIDLSLQLIQQYSILLNELSSSKFNESLTKNTDELNKNLGNLIDIANPKISNKIPSNVKDIVTKVIMLIGQKLTRVKQANALKEFITTADGLIEATTKNIDEAFNDESFFKFILDSDINNFKSSYQNIIFKNTSKVDLSSINTYVNSIKDYENLEQLRQKTIQASKQLSIAHKKLKSNIQSKSEIKDVFDETKDFIVSIKDIVELFKNFQKTIN